MDNNENDVLLEAQQIVLLDGSSWRKDDLLEKMKDDSFYYGYLGSASLSSSSVKILNQSPKAYHRYLRFGSNSDSPALTNGKLFHTMVLEPQELENRFVVVDVASKSTKTFKDAKAASEGKSVITRDEYDDCKSLCDTMFRCRAISDIIQGSVYEKPGIGYVNGYPFRAKADMIHSDGSIYDIKTTSDITSFEQSARRYGYAAQVYIYSKIFSVHFLNFHFIVIDKSTGDLGMFSVSREFYELGERLVRNATITYRDFFIEGRDLDNHIITNIL